MPQFQESIHVSHEEPKHPPHESSERGFRTAFEVAMHWRNATDDWRAYLHAPSNRRDQLFLSLQQEATDERASKATSYCITSKPTGAYLRDILSHPGFLPFSIAAANLATATETVILVLRRFGESSETAEALVQNLRTAEAVPTREDHRASWTIQRQIEQVEAIIWRGDLPPDEDLRERHAFWNDAVSDLRTPEAQHAMRIAVDHIMQSPRDPDRELAILNAVQLWRDYDEKMVPLTKILVRPSGDPASICARWQELAAYGLRFFSHAGGRRDGVETVSFHDQVAARKVYPNAPIDSPELRWAGEAQRATEALHPLATAAGFHARDGLAISELVGAFVQILEGVEVDIRLPIQKVHVIVTAILARASAKEPTNVSQKSDSPSFIKEGSGWVVSFEGKRAVIKDSTGMKYIQRLLSSDEPISAPQLEGLAVSGFSKQPVVDQKALHEYRELLGEVEGKLAETQNLTTEQRDALLANKRELESEIAAATFAGRDREMRSDASAAANRVRGAISRAMVNIKAAHPELHGHLDESLIGRNGASPCYRPSTLTTWQVNPVE